MSAAVRAMRFDSADTVDVPTTTTTDTISIPLAVDWLGRTRTIFVTFGPPQASPRGGLGLLLGLDWHPLLSVELVDGEDVVDIVDRDVLTQIEGQVLP